MFLPPFCEPDDVARRLGTSYTDSTERDQVLATCADVSALIRARLPLIDLWVLDGSVSTDTVVAIACQVVARVRTTLATGGVGLRAETHPEYSYELTASAAAGLNLTKAELAALTPRAGRERPFSIQPSSL